MTYTSRRFAVDWGPFEVIVGPGQLIRDSANRMERNYQCSGSNWAGPATWTDSSN